MTSAKPVPKCARLQALWHYRPRVLTLLVLAIVAVPLTLANFTADIQRQEQPCIYKGMYGWPLRWHWHDFFAGPGPTGIFGWGYSCPRLAGNVLLWFAMLAAPAGVCEWLLRLYRPGLRWRLRTMLGFVAIVAALCGLIADARNRADLQDPIITPLEKDYQTVYVERAGPKWLEFVMPDRYRRRLVGIKMQMHDGATLDEEQIKHLTRLPRLQHLQINVEHRTHGMAVALPEMRRLRSLRIDEYGSLDEDERISHEFLAAIGTLTELERLSLEDVTVTRQSLAHLSGLTKLQSLWLQGFNEDEDLFAYLPPLPRLESIDFGHAQLSSRALQGLSAFPRLKALNLSDAELSRDADLMELASLASLEVLAIDADMLSTGGTQAFGALKQLKKLHVGDQFWSDDEGLITIALDRGKVAVFEPKAEAAQHALQALRRANPSITIDSDTLFMLSNLVLVPGGLDDADFSSSWLPAYIEWLPPSLIDQLRLTSSPSGTQHVPKTTGR